jgi:signal transduction histidine kinase
VVDGTGKILDINERCASIFGMTRNALLGRELKSFVSGEIDRIFDGRAEQVELKLSTLHGEPKTCMARLWHLQANDAPPFVLIEILESWTRKNLEIELEVERDRLKTIINCMGDGLGIIDGNYKVRFMNKALTDLAVDNTIGKECYRTYVGNDAPCGHCPLKRGIDRLDINTVEVTGANGRIFQITHSPIRDAESNTAVLEIVKDITESKKMEKRLFELERRAILSKFSSAIAHDLKNSLISINKTHQVLLDDCERIRKDPLRERLIDLSTGSELMLGLLNDMLDIFQDGYSSLKLRKTCFNFEEIVSDALSLLRAAADEKDVLLEFHPWEKNTVLWGDRRRLQRVIINLLDNAIKFSSRRDSVLLRSRLICSNGSRPSHLSFSVEDQGPGIDCENLNEIFEMFPKKGDNLESMSGIGMGLHFCKIIVEAHEGIILATNKRGKGSLFKVILPI